MHSLETLERLNRESAERELAERRGRLETLCDGRLGFDRRAEVHEKLRKVRARLLELATSLLLLGSCGPRDKAEEPEPGPIDPAPPYGKVAPRIWVHTYGDDTVVVVVMPMTD